ncbi:MAG: lactonase family protein [Bryobacteraceae bacterium]|jgi:6-phosphogluconolactonase
MRVDPKHIGVLAGLFLFLLGASVAFAASSETFVYIGTYTRTHGKGIYTLRFNPATGKLTELTLAAEISSPSFLAVHPNKKFLYAESEHEGEDVAGKNNSVSAFVIDPKTGALTFLNKVSTRGEGPAHIAVDKTGKGLLAANYRSGSVALMPILPDGRLGEVTGFDQHHGTGPKPRQDRPRAHGVAFSPDNRFALVAENGIDEVMIYHYDASTGSLTPNDPPFFKTPPGYGPRHLLFHPNGRFLYSLNEMESFITVLEYGAAGGTMNQIQEVRTLPADFKGTSAPAQFQIDRAGKFIYASNRGADSIAVLAVDPSIGKLTPVEFVSTQGKTPRDFNLDPTGRYLFAANQVSDNVVIFRVDSKTGRLTPTGQVVSNVPEPACVVFVPAN